MIEIERDVQVQVMSVQFVNGMNVKVETKSQNRPVVDKVKPKTLFKSSLWIDSKYCILGLTMEWRWTVPKMF